jgi:hypothetical protein
MLNRLFLKQRQQGEFPIVEYLVVGGGGAGGHAPGSVNNSGFRSIGGGGGGGGVLSGSCQIQGCTEYRIHIGAGGAGTRLTPGDFTTTASGTYMGWGQRSGGDSFFASVRACGGGAGGVTTYTHYLSPIGCGVGPGCNGGSGGGGAQIPQCTNAGDRTKFGGTGVPGQGFAGAAGWCGVSIMISGGGGGAGGAGQQGMLMPGVPTAAVGGNGGPGITSTITGTGPNSITVGGGGGGSRNPWSATYGDSTGLGKDGGGNGGQYNAPAAPRCFGTDGTTNRGGGGGASGFCALNNSWSPGQPIWGTNAGSGGSGIVVIAYPNSFPTIPLISPTLTYTCSDASRPGYRVYCFTGGTGAIRWGSDDNILAETLVLAGGGGGGSRANTAELYGAGGGGAGGLIESISGFNRQQFYCIVVGGGGAGGAANSNGSSGSNSCLYGVVVAPNVADVCHIACGGGFGATPPNYLGGDGGSGGGVTSHCAISVPVAPGTTCVDLFAMGGRAVPFKCQGNDGSASGGRARAVIGGGAGGGAGCGATCFILEPSHHGVYGGAAKTSSITGTSRPYAGGGGGGSARHPTTLNTGASTPSAAPIVGCAGLGGGGAGNGGTANNAPLGPAIYSCGTSGSANLGGGGGGAAAGIAVPAPLGSTPRLGGAGGSGVVILAYPSTCNDIAVISPTLTYTVSVPPAAGSRPGYKVYCFTAGTGCICWDLFP